ncbi:ATP-binding protein [Streptomyces sp. PLAI1-29]|uniref:ATP-binding protein n=1 Tax=Streptomyces zingiberis TaxID=2053010 RepID=A0ABX1C4H2_9ACTN|nr:ATP-binding protein [Streptomyces zingiberis]
MAGLGSEEWQPRRAGAAAAARWAPGTGRGAGRAPGEERTRTALRLSGDPAAEEVVLASRPESAARARRLAEAVVVGEWGLSPRLAEDVVLLVSELVGNAVRHTGARTFGLRMRLGRCRIRVELRDPSRGLPCLMPVRELDENGRGLFLVDTLADRWGVDLWPVGKTTWFELRIPERRGGPREAAPGPERPARNSRPAGTGGGRKPVTDRRTAPSRPGHDPGIGHDAGTEDDSGNGP